jgi:hypothetical protein
MPQGVAKVDEAIAPPTPASLPPSFRIQNPEFSASLDPVGQPRAFTDSAP